MSIPPRTIRRDTRVFISAVTRELGSVAQARQEGARGQRLSRRRAGQLPARLPRPEGQAPRADRLVRRRGPHRRALLRGRTASSGPPTRPGGATRSSSTTSPSSSGKPVYVFLTGDGFPADPHEPEAPELQELQEAHRQRLTSTGRDYNPTASAEQLDQKIRSLQIKVERLDGGAPAGRPEGGRHRRPVGAVAGRRRGLGRRRAGGGGLRRLAAAGRTTGSRNASEQEIEQRAQEQERAKQERERIGGGSRPQGGPDDQAGPAGIRRAVPPATADQQGDHGGGRPAACPEGAAGAGQAPPGGDRVPDRPQDRPAGHRGEPVSLDTARAALAKGNYDEVFAAADEQKKQGRELAMLEGTAALARFRQSPKPEWNARALAAFQRAMALADPNSATEWQAWTDAAVSAASVLDDLARYAEAEPLLRDCLRLREANSGPNSPGVAVVLNNLAAVAPATRTVWRRPSR